MPPAAQQFVYSPDDQSCPAMPALPAGPFSVADGSRRRTLRRTWLDTFDWRLHRAGLTLEQVTDRGTASLTLTSSGGELIAALPLGSPGSANGTGRLRWPCLVSELPPGPIRDLLAPVAGVRALLPVAGVSSVVQEQPVLNADSKTVARLTVERMTVRQPARATAPPRLALTAVRGYQQQATRLAGLLAAVPGMSGACEPPLATALAAAGTRPGGYSGKIDVELTAGMPGAAALAVILQALFGKVEANLAGVVADIDSEFLHDLRIALRRTRSALKLAGQVLPADMAARFRPEFKWLADLTNPVRDLDVFLLGYPELTAGLAAAAPEDLRPLRDHLVSSRSAARQRLVRGLRSARFGRLRRDWPAALAAAGQAAPRRPTAGQLGAGRITAAHRKVLTAGRAITAQAPPELLHELRKRCKELRYLLEIFASLYEPAAHRRAVRDLKELQDCLGEFQDMHVQLDRIRSWAAELLAEGAAPPATLLAMGEVAGTLAARQRLARAEFAGRFADFASERSRARFRALTRRQAGPAPA